MKRFASWRLCCLYQFSRLRIGKNSAVLLAAGNDIILNTGSQSYEVGAETADTDDQFLVILGMGLGITQLFSINNVVLDMLAAVLEEGVCELSRTGRNYRLGGLCRA